MNRKILILRTLPQWHVQCCWKGKVFFFCRFFLGVLLTTKKRVKNVSSDNIACRFFSQLRPFNPQYSWKFYGQKQTPRNVAQGKSIKKWGNKRQFRYWSRRGCWFGCVREWVSEEKISRNNKLRGTDKRWRPPFHLKWHSIHTQFEAKSPPPKNKK